MFALRIEKSNFQYEPVHEISNNVVSDQSLCKSLEYSMSVKLLTEHHLQFLSLKGAAQARLSLHLSKCHIVGNHLPRLICSLIRSPPQEHKPTWPFQLLGNQRLWLPFS